MPFACERVPMARGAGVGAGGVVVLWGWPALRVSARNSTRASGRVKRGLKVMGECNDFILLSRAHHDDGHGGRSGAGLVLDCDGEGLRFRASGQWRIDDCCAAASVGLKDAGGDGSALSGDQPEFVSFLWRQRW